MILGMHGAGPTRTMLLIAYLLVVLGVAPLERGEVLVELRDPVWGSGVAVRASGVIDAPPRAVWPVIRDCQHYAEFLPGVRESRAEARDGNRVVCITRIDLPFPLGDLRSETQVIERERADGGFERRWRLLRGSYRHNEGSWTLSPWGEAGARTLAVYQVEIDPETIVPDFLLRRVQARTARDLFEAVRRRVAERGD